MQSQLYETLKHTALAHIDGKSTLLICPSSFSRYGPANAIRKAYSSPDPWDEHAIWQLRTPYCLHHLHPVDSIPAPFNNAIDETAHRNFMRFFGPIFDHCKFEVKDLVIDEKSRIVVAVLRARFDFKAVADEPAEQNWTAEYVWLTEMTEDGRKIKRVEEFMDQVRLLGHVAAKAQKYVDSTKVEQGQSRTSY